VPPTFSHDEALHLFIIEVDGHQATVSYQPAGEAVLDFQSTYVPHVLRNRHVGTQLVRYALDWAKGHGLRVIPSCWFVKVVVERMPEYRPLLTDAGSVGDGGV
jgi:predicted GNAT family acetyltransferase